MDDTGTTAEATHPPGIIVEIVGIEKGNRGRLCEDHDVCGEVVEEDGKEETSITCYWVTDGIDSYRAGFLKRHMVKHAWRFGGALVQVTKIRYSLHSVISSHELSAQVKRTGKTARWCHVLVDPRRSPSPLASSERRRQIIII